MFEHLPRISLDPILVLDQACRADTRPGKLDLGVGIYRDANGHSNVLDVVKQAELVLQQTQPTKAYVSPLGDPRFITQIAALAFAQEHLSRVAGIQVPGGGGAVRLTADLVCSISPGSRVILGLPAWGNYIPIFEAAGLAVECYPYFDAATQVVRFDRMMDAVERSQRGDVLLIQAACHNPSGADLSLQQWKTLAEGIAARGIIPLVDFAYQGFGDGLEEDRLGLNVLLDTVEEALVAYSCSKNFALYRERVGVLFMVGRNASEARTSLDTLGALARVSWSMPPDHGSAVVRTILEDDTLTKQWRAELAAMRRRLQMVRATLADLLPELPALRAQKGMFSVLPLPESAIAELRSTLAIYMPASGRVNIAGLNDVTVLRFANAARPGLSQAHVASS